MSLGHSHNIAQLPHGHPHVNSNVQPKMGQPRYSMEFKRQGGQGAPVGFIQVPGGNIDMQNQNGSLNNQNYQNIYHQVSPMSNNNNQGFSEMSINAEHQI